MTTRSKRIVRCGWEISDPLMIEYHDTEWGVPVHDDSLHYEYLVLDAAQAGLSWRTVLLKRENYRKALHGFDYRKIAKYGDKDVARLLANEGIIRNRQKIMSAISNAKAFLGVQKEFGSFDNYVWLFTGGKTIRNRWKSLSELPAKSQQSEAMSKDLVARGFKFVGPTICYAYMQAAGLVNDHTVSCFRHKQV